MSHKDCPENRIIVLREFDILFVFAHPSLCSYSIWCTAPACRRRLASNTSYLSRTFLLQVVRVPNTVIRSIVHKIIQRRQLTASRQREFSIATRIFGVSGCLLGLSSCFLVVLLLWQDDLTGDLKTVSKPAPHLDTTRQRRQEEQQQ